MVRASASRFASQLTTWAGLMAVLLALCAPALARADAAARGVAVVSMGAVESNAAYALAQEVYRSARLRPSGIDEAKARVLIGQAPSTPSAETSRLAELREGVRDEGAVSRSVLGALANASHAEAVALLRPSEAPGHLQIRLFLLAQSSFDVSLYDGDAGDPAWRSEVVHALERRFDPEAAAAAPPVAGAKKPKGESSASTSFYKSPWFWGAIGGAVLLGGTALLISHVTSSEDVRIRVEPPVSSTQSALGWLRGGSFAP